MKTLSNLTVAHASDLVVAQKRARRLAGRLGFSAQAQTEVETALSEVAWTVLKHAPRARVEMSLEREPNRFRIKVFDDDYSSDSFELAETEHLVDGMEIRNDRAGRVVILDKILPEGATVIQGLEEPSYAELDPALIRALHMRARAEAKLRISEQRLLLAIDTAQLATWELEPADGRLIADARCRMLHNIGPDEALDLDGLVLRIDPDHRERAARSIRATLQAQGPAGFEIEYPVTAGRTQRWLFTRGQVLITENGPRAMASVLDISARHRQEEAAKKQAELYQQLVGIVSHDLKNPVQVIIAGLSLLEDGGPLTQRQENILRRVKNATDRAGRLISDLLDFTRDRLGEGIPVVKSRIDLTELVCDVVGAFSIARPDDRIDLELDGEMSAELDRDRMEQVITNLLDNAFEYANPGEAIRVTVTGFEARIEIAVRAHGEPITGELLPRLFEPLSPAVRQRNRRRAGLGLYIVRAIVQGHGGTVDVSSSEDETCFLAVLPRK